MRTIDVVDVEAMINILSSVADPTVEMPLDQRKSALLQRLGALIDADVWIWAVAYFSLEKPGDAVPISLVDGGWTDEQERAVMFGLISNPETTLPFTASFHDAVTHGQSLTLSRDQVIDDETWHTEPMGKKFLAVGFEHFVISSYPIGQGLLSNIGFHRRVGKPPFSERDRIIFHVMVQQIDWLHRTGSNVAASEKVIELSPRERQVTMLLMGGDSRKQVAAKLHLSEHTVADYLKEIYRKLAVNSRAELLAKFLPSGKQGQHKVEDI